MSLQYYRYRIKNTALAIIEKVLHKTGINILTGTYKLSVETTEVRLRTALSKPIRIVHLTDLHASTASPYWLIEEAVDMSVAERPDLICMTGDYVSGKIFEWDRYRTMLSKLAAAAPVYACFGNHDGCHQTYLQGGYGDTVEVRRLLESAGINCLENEKAKIEVRGQELTIAGLGEWRAGSLKPETVLSKHAIDEEYPLLLLFHSPSAVRRIIDFHWDLALCGHTHGGQVKIPLLGMPLLSRGESEFADGLYQLGARQIYVSRGVGNLFALRINCNPRVSVLEIN